MASSRVGAKIKVLSVLVPDFVILFKMGSTKAAVLPVPVCAQAIRSFPVKITGIAISCMGVGVSKPMASSPSCKEDSKLNELKFKLR
jgi:hypothetical protein